MIKILNLNSERVEQGDIISKVEYLEEISEISGELEIKKIEFPNIIVLSQDCDLEQDNNARAKDNDNNDKFIFSVLVAPIYNSDHFFKGEHLSYLDLKMNTWNKTRTEGKNIMNNDNPRFHYLKFDKNIPVVDSIIDFKHFFSININTIRVFKQRGYKGRAAELYREQITLRFSNYLSRIGLP